MVCGNFFRIIFDHSIPSSKELENSKSMKTIPTGIMGSCENLFSITIPKSVTSIDVAAFFNCSSLSIINYSGSQSDWESVEKGSNNGNLLDAYVVYYYGMVDDEESDSTVPLIFIVPTKNYTVGKRFSDNELQYNSTTKYWEVHEAVDFLTVDSEPVYAVQDGVVNSVQTSYGRGTFFSITHRGVTDNYAPAQIAVQSLQK